MSSPVSIDRPQSTLIRLTLNQPKKRNALDNETRNALIVAMRDALADDEARAIIITGAGGVFCAGGDIAAMGTLDEHGASRRMTLNHELVRLFHGAEKPIVAAVQGFAMGAGAGIALLCDAIVAGEDAVFGFPFFRLGLVPDYGLLHTLPLRVGIATARLLLMRSANVKAKEARKIGLVDVVAGSEKTQEEAAMLALELGAQPRFAFGLAKSVLSRFPMAFDEALAAERTAQVACFLSNDHDEGVAAFREKRAPKF